MYWKNWLLISKGIVLDIKAFFQFGTCIFPSNEAIFILNAINWWSWINRLQIDAVLPHSAQNREPEYYGSKSQLIQGDKPQCPNAAYRFKGCSWYPFPSVGIYKKQLFFWYIKRYYCETVHAKNHVMIIFFNKPYTFKHNLCMIDIPNSKPST